MKKIIGLFLFSVYLSIGWSQPQPPDAVHLKCNDTINISITGFFMEQCVYAISYGSAKYKMKQAILETMAFDIICSSEDCPPKPHAHSPRCFKTVHEELPVPTIEPDSGDTLRFCFTFTDTIFAVGCNVCEYIRPWWGAGDEPLAPDSESVYLKKIDLQISPNPSEGQLNIFYSTPQASDLYFRIVSTGGQVVKSLSQMKVSAGTHRLSLNVEGLASGMYFVQLMNANQIVKSTRFIKT